MLKLGVLILLTLLIPSTALAEVKVEISNNLDGSNNNVQVNSDTSSNTQTLKNMNNQTNIRINNNGEVKEYHGSDGKVEIKSGDGKSSVSVNTTGASNNSAKPSSSSPSKTNITVNSNTDDVSPSSTPEATEAGIFKEDIQTNEKPGIFEMIKRQLQAFFSIFS